MIHTVISPTIMLALFFQICMLCIRCKSCGVTPGKSSDMSWNRELELCPDCNKLHSKGLTMQMSCQILVHFADSDYIGMNV